MKTAIVYSSYHHGNTKKLVDAIAERHEVTLIDADAVDEAALEGFERIGFAAGIAYGHMYKAICEVITNRLPAGKEVFFLYTCGNMRKGYTAKERAAAKTKGCKLLGEYGCLGFDTYGPFKIVGGIAKGHPTAEEIAAAVHFFEELV